MMGKASQIQSFDLAVNSHGLAADFILKGNMYIYHETKLK
jgi:hypothetical protein